MRSALSKWIVVFAGLLVAVSCGSAQRFQNPPYIPVANGYYQVLSGDLYGNGRQDLVYWSQAGNGAWYDVFRNDGGRQFTDLGRVSLGPSGISQALLQDFNGDGKPDLVFLSWYNGSNYTLQFLAGNGDGTFAAPVVSQITSNLFLNYAVLLQFYAGKFNGDGHLDLAVTLNPGVPPIDVLTNDGTGRFTRETQLDYLSGSSYPQPLMGVVDLNNDGLDDMALWSFRTTNTIQVYMNQGNGQFQLVTAYTLPTGAGVPSGVVFADMNGDGIPDLICNDGNYLYLAVGKGDGTFTQTSQTPFLTDGWLIGAKDMNGDGRPDLIVQENEGFSILLKGADFSFTALPVALTGSETRAATVADVDGDGNTDIVTAVSWPDDTSGISMLWGSSGGVLASAYGYRAPYYLEGAAMAHFTSGPAPDIAAQPAHTELPLTFRNNGDGTFNLLPDPNPYVPPTNQPPLNYYTYGLQTGDFNGDGLPDLLESGQFGTVVDGDVGGPWLVQSLAGNGNGSFGAAVQVLNYLSNSNAYRASTAGDLNSDGIDDIAVAYYDTVDILLGQKGGGWKLSQSFQAANNNGSSQAQAVFGDWNGDGILDVAIQYTTEIQFYLGNGDGTFTAGQTLNLPFDASLDYITAGDVDGDGNVDLLVTQGASGLYPLYGNGDGTFTMGQPIAIYPSGNFAFGLGAQIADVNRDGWPDLVIAVPDGIVVRYGQGNRTWNTGETYVSGDTFEQFSVDQADIQSGFWVQDLNQDGFPDIALQNNAGSYVNSNIVSVLLNLPAVNDLTGTLTISPEPQQQGASATATVTVKPALAGGATPTGTIQLTVDGVAAGSGTLAGGQLQLPLGGASALAPGRHFVVAAYSGDATYHAARFTAVHWVIGQTETTLTAAPNPVAEGSPLLLTATVSSGDGTPSGTVDFVEGTTVLGQGTLNASGIASLTLNTLAPGQHVLVAKYLGTSQFPASTSASVTVTVLIPTTTTLSASATSLTVGQQLTLTATVKATQGSTPAGTVTFNNGPTSLGSAALNANGTASLTLTPAVGTYTITATYSGSAVDASSTSSPVVIQVTTARTATTTVLTSSANPSPAGSSVTFTATVNNTAQTQTPTGSVTFYDGVSSLGTVSLTSSSAALQTSSLSVGTHNIKAVYSGDLSFLASTSNTIQEVIASFADFAVTATPGLRSVYTGETAAYTISVQTVNPVVQSGAGFTLPVDLSCSGLPANTTCQFSPATIPGETGTSALKVQTTAPSGTKTTSATARYGAALVSLALLLLPWLQRKRWLMLLLAAAITAFGASAITGCADGTLYGGTPPGSYTITITGTATNGSQTLRHSTALHLDVKSLF
jgi:Bacterial Ig-like domain (group 3)/FG-GAP-like repeat